MEVARPPVRALLRWTLRVAAGLCVCASSASAGTSSRYTAKDISVTAKRLLYVPEESGRPYYFVTFVLRNNAPHTAYGVGGLVSIHGSDGSLLTSFRPTPVTIPPKGLGILTKRAVRLPVRNHRGPLTLRVSVKRFARPTAAWPYTVADLSYQRVPGQLPSDRWCTVTGEVVNRARPTGTVLVTVATYVNGRVLASDVDAVDNLGSRVPFEVSFVTASTCPSAVGRIVATVQPL